MSELKEYAEQILDSLRKKIYNYFQSFKSDQNLLYVDFLDDVVIYPAQNHEYDIGIPLEKGKKVDFAMVSAEYSIPLLASLKFKDFPLKEVMVRIKFPPTLYGVSGENPKIIFSAELNIPWPGDFGLAWLPLTGTEQFAFHPYEDKDKRSQEIENFFNEGVLDPLCDFLNSSKHVLATRLRTNIKEFLESKNKEVLNYLNPFVPKKKANFNIIEVPIYCEYIDDQDTSFLYFECYSLKDLWIPPAEIIVNILQLIALSTEVFDYDGNLVQEKLDEIAAKIEGIDTKTAKLEKKIKSAKLKEEWDPFKPTTKIKRDTLGYSTQYEDGTLMQDESKVVLDQVARMKNLMQTRLGTQATTPQPREIPQQPTAPTPQPTAPAPQPTAPAPQPTAPAPQPTAPAPQPKKTASAALLDEIKQQVIKSAEMVSSKPEVEFQFDDEPKALEKQIVKTAEPRLRGQRPTPTPEPATPTLAPAPQPATPAPSPTKALPTFANAKAWFDAFQMKQFTLIGDGNDLPFRKRGDFKLLASMQKPFMLTFARNHLRMKKSATTTEVIEILFELYKSGHLTPL